MIVRFSTLVEAVDMEQAWDNLWQKLRGGDLGDRVERIFTATFPENPDENKKMENVEEKTTPVAVIEADELLEWLNIQWRQAEDFCSKVDDVRLRGHWLGEMSALSAVMTHVKAKKYLVDPADTEEEKE